MTGPEHYREAERLANQANHFTYGDGADPVTGAALAAEAQTHATLALAAAVAATGMTGMPGMPPRDGEAWYRTISTQPPTSGTVDRG